MYEFITALTCVAAIFFCYIVMRYRAWALGVFVMGAVGARPVAESVESAAPAEPAVPAFPVGGGAGRLPTPRTDAFRSMWEAGPWVRIP
jgi:hypothetical protein